MIRTEKAIEDANGRLSTDNLSENTVKLEIDRITLAYYLECDSSRFKTRLCYGLCLCIGLVIGLSINA